MKLKTFNQMKKINFKPQPIIQAALIFMFIFVSSCEEKIIETDKAVNAFEGTGIKINKEQEIIDLDNSGVTGINAIDTIDYNGHKLPEYKVTVEGSIANIEEIKPGTIVNIPSGDKGGILLFVTDVKEDVNKSANTLKGTGAIVLEGFQATLDMYFNYESATLEFSTPGNRAKENLDIPNKIANNTIDYLDVDVKFEVKNKDEDTKISFSSTPTQLCKLGFSSKIWQSKDKDSYVAFNGSIGIQPAMDFYMHYEPVLDQSASSKLMELLESAVVPDAVLLAYKDQNYYLGNMKQLTANFYASIDRDLEITVHLAKEFERKDPYSIPLGGFVIPTVPVSAQIEVAIEFDPKAAGSVDLTIYDKLESDIAFGIDLDRDIGEPEWYFESNKESESGLELKAKVELTAGVYLVLSTEAYVIGILGPEIKAEGGVEGKAMVEGNIGTSTAPSASWQLKADWVVKSEAKLNLSAFHVDKATWSMWNKAFLEVRGNIYTAPHHLGVISGNNQSGALGQTLNSPVEIGVYDNFDNLIKYLPVPVYVETDNGGSFSDNPVVSSSGTSSVDWTLGNTEETQYMNAYFMVDGNKSDKVQIEATGDDNGGTGETGTLKEGLVSYWKLDGDLNDSHGNNNGIKATGVTSLTDGGIINYSPYFNGNSRAYITCGNDQSLNVTGTSISMSAWVYNEKTSGQADIISKGRDYTSNKGYHLRWYCNSQKLVAIYRLSNGENNSVDITGLENNKWYHIVSTFDGQYGKLYVNDELVNTTDKKGSIGSATTQFTIGAHSAGPTGWGYQWKGNIDEVGIWNKVLKSDEIKALYNDGSGLQYPFE